ncbi:hypothetical protein [Shewanella frigidimarina]|uniref:hypothetical protein n=1 Tax=Shewanella frigidimarina TaxID=56812 RepID=UPI003D7A9157
MTTVFGIASQFLAVDSRWTYKGQTKPVDEHPTRKMVQFGNEIAFFAGDELPIVVEQASFLELVDDDIVLELMAHLSDSGEVMETLTVEESNGQIISGYPNYYPRLIETDSNLLFLGSGGIHACDFFYYARKKGKLSDLKCNALGAVRYASIKDDATGGRTSCQVWTPNHSCERFLAKNELSLYDINDYNSYIRIKVQNAYNLINTSGISNMSKSRPAATLPLKSDFSSAPRDVRGESTLRQVSLSDAVSRLAARKARRSKS